MGRHKIEDTGIKGRLLQFIEYKDITPFRFSTICGFSSSYVRNMRKTITQRSLKHISNKFPELNTHWLSTGEGQMLNEVIPISVQNNTCGNNSHQTIVAGSNQQVTTPEQNDRQLIKLGEENAALKEENTALRTKVEMLQEQVNWLRTLVKQQQS